MKLKLSINRHTLPSELMQISMFLGAVALTRGGSNKPLTAPTDPAELDEPEGEVTYVAATPEQEAAIDAATGITPKRRRRTKDEVRVDAIVAENARVAAAEAEAQASNEAQLKAIEEQAGAVAPGEAGNVPAPTPPAPPPAMPQSDPASTTPASASPSEGKTYTPAEVQGLAVDTARRYGPEKVKALIATYPGAAKIADLPESELAGFVVKLQAITA